MEPEVSLLCSGKLTTLPYSEYVMKFLFEDHGLDNSKEQS